MKRVLLSVLLLATAAGHAAAAELWDPHLRGVDEGLAAGAALPQGVYGVWNQWYSPLSVYDQNGHKTGVSLDALVEVPILLWQSDYTFLGATYSAAIAQPFDYTNVKAPGVAGLSDNGHWGTFNTVLVPVQLNWTLPQDFHVKAGLTINLDDASSSPAHPPAGGGVGSGNGYTTIQPDFAVSWMRDGWAVTINAHYDANLTDSHYVIAGGTYRYHSGDQIAVDYTITKDIGKWMVGLGGYSETQIARDSGQGAVLAGCPASGGCKAANYGIGPMVQYNFGGLIGLAEYNVPISTRSDVGGQMFNIRAIVPF